MLKDKINKKETGFLFYGLTPPKVNVDEQKIKAIADKQIERLEGVDIDALVLYDIQDESSRTDMPRPFPFLQTISPSEYSNTYLRALNTPKIIYKSVGHNTAAEFTQWIEQQSASVECVVFVGTPSKQQVANLSLHDAYTIKQNVNPPFVIGGVTIPERHNKKGDEHLRVFDKIDRGCSFFISQCVYDVNNAKNFLSDYYYTALANNQPLVPIIFTLTPCGSLKTLQFMEWLGIDIPRWLNNDLKHANDILAKSTDMCRNIARELLDFSISKNIPIGFNIESVAIRKEEIEASIELLKDVRNLMQTARKR